jgi:hypothetical protein
MSEQSVSRAEESRREKNHESSRKKTSIVKALKPKSSDSFTRADQHATVVGPNEGSNKNFGRAHESESAPEHKPQGGFGYTKPQFQRRHEQAPSVEDGAIDNRKVRESAVAERHVQSDDGFKIAERRNAAVVGNRKSTAKTFDERRKKSSSV